MAFDEALATRVRKLLATRAGVDEQHMFGGVAFLLEGRMVCGVLGEALVLRLGPEGTAAALARPHVRPMDFTGKVLRSMVFVDPAGCRRAPQLRGWLERALQFQQELSRSAPQARPRRRATAHGGRARRRA